MKTDADRIIEKHVDSFISGLVGFLIACIDLALFHIQLWIAVPMFIVVVAILEIRGIFKDVEKLGK
jgi:hypothetical protein